MLTPHFGRNVEQIVSWLWRDFAESLVCWTVSQRSVQKTSKCQGTFLQVLCRLGRAVFVIVAGYWLGPSVI